MSYRLERVQRSERVLRAFDVTCDNCGAALEPTGPVDPEGGWHLLEAKGALKLVVVSGHDTFFGFTPHQDPIAFFCHDCAQQLSAAFPCFDRIMREAQ